MSCRCSVVVQAAPFHCDFNVNCALGFSCHTHVDYLCISSTSNVTHCVDEQLCIVSHCVIVFPDRRCSITIVSHCIRCFFFFVVCLVLCYFVLLHCIISCHVKCFIIQLCIESCLVLFHIVWNLNKCGLLMQHSIRLYRIMLCISDVAQLS